MREPTEDDFLYLPEAEAAAPVKGSFFQRYADFWWAVRPGYGLVFFNPRKRDGHRRASFLGFPQCNADERIKQLTAQDNLPFEVEVRKIPLVFVPVNLSDYR